MNVFKTLLLRSTVAAGFIAAGMVPAAAIAQTADDQSAQTTAAPDQTEVDAVVVVGSRIRRDTFNSPSPVQVFTREDQTLAGFNSASDVLQGAGVTGGSSQVNNAFGGYVTEGGPGANTLSLRGLGAGRTLVLINGRRVSPAGSRGAVGSADLNVLPNAMIDRVEILRDGASSIYGSDAIAGVVNVITRSKVDGLTVEGQYNAADGGAGDSMRFSAVGGLTRDRWNFSGSLEYYERKDLTLGDRDWTRCNTDYRFDRTNGGRLDYIDPTTGKPKCYPVTTTGSNGVTINTIGTNMMTGVGAPGSVGTEFNRWRPNGDITSGLVGYEGVGGGANDLNVRDTFEKRMLNESLISPAKVYTAFGQFTYDLQALGNAEVYGEVLLNQRKSEQTNYRQLSLDYAKGSTLIPDALQGSTLQTAPTALTNGQALGVRAFIGFGNDQSEQDVKYGKLTGGIRGDLSFLPGWRYDAMVAYAKSDASYTQQSWLTDRLAQSLNVVAAPAGTPSALVRKDAYGNDVTCAVNVTNPNAGCIAAPVLNAQTVGGVLPKDWVDYTFRNVTGNTTYEETTFALAADGPVYDLPAGSIQLAVGLEYRKAEIDDTPSIHSQTGNLYNLTTSAVTRGSDSVWEVYGEAEIPVLKDLAWADSLTLNLSGRYTNYDSYGSDWTYKVGAAYAPVDWLSFRATYGTSFRAPALFEQFQGATSGFLSATGDPCNNYAAAGGIRAANCALELPGQGGFNQTSSIAVISAGGAEQGLEAETSKNFTAGFVLQPHLPEAWGDFSFAVDYYEIEVNNGVSRVGASSILSLCYNDPDFRAGGGWCNFVDQRDASGALTVRDSYTNVATQIVEGVDYTARWSREIGPGKLLINANVTQYLSQAEKLFATDAIDQLNGTIGSPKFTGTLDATYSWGDWRVRYGMEWLDGMDSYAYLGEDPATSEYDFKVDDYFLHNVSVQYRAADWSATVGVRNIADETPPSISSGYYNRVGNAPLYSGYDYIGRQMFVNFSKSF